MNSNPLVSIIINNYNYEVFLSQAIDSALNQTYNNLEVIVVDDGSTDNSSQIIESYGNQITPVMKENGGQASAFNIGFEKSQGEIICFLDSDDTFLPSKAQNVVEIFTTQNNIGWCFHEVLRVDNSFKPLLGVKNTRGASGLYDFRELMRTGGLRGNMPLNGIITSGMCLTKELLGEILPMPSEIKITSDDYIKYAALGTSIGYALLEPLACQRIHLNNAYTTFRDDKKSLRAKVMIQTAYFLRKNYPKIKAYANNLFSLGLAQFKENQQEDLQLQSLIRDYVSSLSLLEFLNIELRKNYHLYVRR
ncbi:MAG: glycosyltransferase [Cyanobacteria bacterium P01_G01_bin.49]